MSELNVRMEYWWNKSYREKTETFLEKICSLPHRSAEVPRGLAWDLTRMSLYTIFVLTQSKNLSSR